MQISITNIQYPQQVNENKPFTISYTVINEGSPIEVWGALIDETKNRPIKQTYWVDIVTGTKDISHSFSEGTPINIPITIMVGKT